MRCLVIKKGCMIKTNLKFNNKNTEESWQRNGFAQYVVT